MADGGEASIPNFPRKLAWSKLGNNLVLHLSCALDVCRFQSVEAFGPTLAQQPAYNSSQKRPGPRATFTVSWNAVTHWGQDGSIGSISRRRIV